MTLCVLPTLYKSVVIHNDIRFVIHQLKTGPTGIVHAGCKYHVETQKPNAGLSLNAVRYCVLLPVILLLHTNSICHTLDNNAHPHAH